MEDTARLLTELDDFIKRAMVRGRSRCAVTETLLKAITAELLPLARQVQSLQPALERIATVAQALERGERTRFDPLPVMWPPVIAMDKPRKPRSASAIQNAIVANPNLTTRAP
jgi:hypothetical protein